jgi:branched-subunit amino acid ABC-type transport system permease component
MGLSMIFGVLQVVNVGYAAFIMVGATTAEALSHPEVIDVYLGRAPE